ncbi:hypothetical protein FACS1894219_08370 [Clostridia bacterium]|nr:hypothetical protein FACS1894219_08370 [Clostridia bacterium]
MTTTTTAAMTASAATTVRNAEREPLKIAKRIGSGTFIINVFAGSSATETLEQKLLRILESEVRKLA